jgi:hypothetical protein
MSRSAQPEFWRKSRARVILGEGIAGMVLKGFGFENIFDWADKSGGAKTRDCAARGVEYLVLEWIGSNLWRWGLWPPRLRACFGGVFARVDFLSNVIRTAVVPLRPRVRRGIPLCFTPAKTGAHRLQ